MALTTADEMELQSAGFIDKFEAQRAVWLEMALEAYAYTRKTVSGVPKYDDVAPHLELALQAREEFRALKKELSAKPKYWNQRFADLIVNRVWNELLTADEGANDGNQSNQAQPS